MDDLVAYGNTERNSPRALENLRLGKEMLEIVNRGNNLAQQGKHDAALREFQRALTLYPNRPEAKSAYEGMAQVYLHTGQLREAEKAFHAAFGRDPGAYDYVILAQYALLEIRLNNRQEAFLAYETARRKLLKAYKEAQGNMPVFDNLLETKQLEAAVRLIAMYDKRYGGTLETCTEMEQIVTLSPKFAYAHFLLAKCGLWGKYENDPAGYRKAAKPHYEAAVKYGIGDIQKQAQEALQTFRTEEQNSKP
jgi:tetratricopeptide (TPR) repeat protein